MSERLKLFIPGPTEVHPEILAEMARPAIGHRGEACAKLWSEARKGVAHLMRTSGEVVLLPAPASALMEAAVRNGVRDRSLHLVCGAFSQRWHEMARECGKRADKLEVEWGSAVSAEMLAERLAGDGPYDAVTVVHNETSTGVTNPIQEYAAVLADYPDTLLMVDTVSSLAGMPVEVDGWGIDLCLAGVQKALALPAGMSVAALSPRLLARAEQVPGRGWFLDLLRLVKGNAKEQSPATPSTPHLYALVKQLARVREEGLESRWARHRRMAEQVRAWACEKGWALFADEGCRSDTVTCIARGDGPDFVPALAALKERGYLVSSGYGPLKGKTFRIGHLGEHTVESVADLLEQFDAVLREGMPV